ncbi:MAG: Rieske 2Fe-2S domain-containing protein [Gammaproteobacteria bacterium]
MNESSPDLADGSLAEPFDDEWYAVAPAQKLKRSKPLRIELHGRRLVLWRTDTGQVTALDDRCPHLGASLSAGRVHNHTLVCPYHGLRFNAEGQCVHIPGQPANEAIPRRMCNRTWLTHEVGGWIFIQWSAPDTAPAEPPQLPQEIDTHGSASSWSIRDWPVHYSRAIENALDVLHFAEIHRALFWIPVLPEEQVVIKTEDKLIHFTVKDRLRGVPKDFCAGLVYPNLWYQRMGPLGVTTMALVPSGKESTRIYLRTDVTMPPVPGLKQLVAHMTHWFYMLALWQDSRVVFEQTPRTVEEANDILIGYDRLSATYRKMRQANRPE